MMNLFKNIELTDEEEEILDRIHEQTPLDPVPQSEESPEQPEAPAESDEHADDE